jgi:hypothetical protein
MKRKSGSFPAEFSLNGFQKLIVEQEKRDEIMSRVNDAARGAQGGGCQPLYLHYRIWMPRPSMN